MYYVYVLKLDNDQIYVGYTSDLERRYKEHKNKQSTFTSKHEIELVYYEAYKSKEDATRREAKLKQRGNAKRFLKERIAKSLE